MYGWGDSVGDACGANGEAAMYGATNTPEPCSPVDFVHTTSKCIRYACIK